MTLTKQGNHVTLQMTRDDFDTLLLELGTAAGAAARDHDRVSLYRSLDLANRLNATNPDFTPYEIPAEYQRHDIHAGA